MLTMLELGTWLGIGSLVAILALLTVLKRAFAAERAALLAPMPRGRVNGRRELST